MGHDGALGLENQGQQENSQLWSTGGNWDPRWKEEEEEGGLEGATILFPGAAGWSWRRRNVWARRG